MVDRARFAAVVINGRAPVSCAEVAGHQQWWPSRVIVAGRIRILMTRASKRTATVSPRPAFRRAAPTELGERRSVTLLQGFGELLALGGVALGGSEVERIDLRDAELDGLDIPHVCFTHSNLEGAHLAGPKLAGSSSGLAGRVASAPGSGVQAGGDGVPYVRGEQRLRALGQFGLEAVVAE